MIKQWRKKKMNKQLHIEEIQLQQNINFVRGMETTFEKEQFPIATEKVIEMVRNPIPKSIRIMG